jgi:hypothetical protein
VRGFDGLRPLIQTQEEATVGVVDAPINRADGSDA